MVPGRFVSGSSSRLAPPEAAEAVEAVEGVGKPAASRADHVDTSFIHPTEAAQHHAHGQDHPEDGSYWLMQPVYDSEYLEVVKPRYVMVDAFVARSMGVSRGVSRGVSMGVSADSFRP
jgi:hypothetical protein